MLGIVGDDEPALDAVLDRALRLADVVLLSGGTSKGAGDLSYRVLAGARLGSSCTAWRSSRASRSASGAVGTTPVAILPGFPTSAIFTFHEFVAPVVRAMAGLRARSTPASIAARMPARFNSEIGRTEYLLVNLVDGPEGLAAYPLGKGSGSVTTLQSGRRFRGHPPGARVRRGGRVGRRRPARPGDRRRPTSSRSARTASGSTCCSACLVTLGFTSKTLWVGSQGGLIAAGRGECDIAGVHLLDPSDRHVQRAVPSRGRAAPPRVRPDAGPRLPAGRPTVRRAVLSPRRSARALADPGCFFVNRNRGSGTRVLIDGLLAGARPPGYAVEARSHNAVAAAVAQGRADWGVAIAPVAEAYGLGFLPIRRRAVRLRGARERGGTALPWRLSGDCSSGWTSAPGSRLSGSSWMTKGVANDARRRGAVWW